MNKIKLGKLNLFDIVVILIIGMCVGFILIKFIPTNNASNQEQSNNTFSYVIRVEGISDTSEDMIKIGDKIYDKVTNTEIGTIIDLKAEPAMTSFEKLDGTIIKAELPNKINIDITVETEGKIQNGEYIANGLIRILIGQTKQIKTKYWMASGFITSIN